MYKRIFAVSGYKVTDIRFSSQRNFIETHLEPVQKMHCHKCNTKLDGHRSKHKMKLRDLPVMTYQNFVVFYRRKGYCKSCKKFRSEKVDIISKTSPHLTIQYEWWLGKLTEIAPVTNTADVCDLNPMTLWRIDFARLKSMLANYEIPDPKMIAVDEIYAKKKTPEGGDRDDRFFTIITDLKTKKVIWVAESRKQRALESFFEILGKDRCKKIVVVSIDQHQGYLKAVQKYCRHATIVWDKLHIMKGFMEAVNDSRKFLLKLIPKKSRSKLIEGKYRYIFPLIKPKKYKYINILTGVVKNEMGEMGDCPLYIYQLSCCT